MEARHFDDLGFRMFLLNKLFEMYEFSRINGMKWLRFTLDVTRPHDLDKSSVGTPRPVPSDLGFPLLGGQIYDMYI